MALDPMQPPSGRDPFARQLTIRQRTEQETYAPLGVRIPIEVTNVKTTNATLYTVPDDRDFILERLSVCNVGTGNATIDIHLVPSGGSADDSNVVYDAFAVNSAATNELVALRETLIPAGTAIIVVTSDATNGCNFWGWGRELTGT